LYFLLHVSLFITFLLSRVLYINISSPCKLFIKLYFSNNYISRMSRVKSADVSSAASHQFSYTFPPSKSKGKYHKINEQMPRRFKMQRAI